MVMDAGSLIPAVLFGLSMASIYFLLAIGLSLCFGLMRVVSIDQFLYYSVGAYMTYTIAARFGSFWLGAAAGIATSCLLAWIIEKALYRRIYERGIMFSLITSFGILFTFIGAIKYLWGVVPRPLATPIAGQVLLLGARLPTYRLFVIGLVALVYVGLWLFLERTIVGKAIRAGIEDVEKTEGLGINVYEIFTVTFLVAAGLSALAGILHAPLIMVDPHMGLKIIPAAFMIVIIGGLGSIKGTLISSLLIGQVVSFGHAIWAPIGDMAPFAIMLLVLLLRPTGFYGSQFLSR